MYIITYDVISKVSYKVIQTSVKRNQITCITITQWAEELSGREGHFGTVNECPTSDKVSCFALLLSLLYQRPQLVPAFPVLFWKILRESQLIVPQEGGRLCSFPKSISADSWGKLKDDAPGLRVTLPFRTEAVYGVDNISKPVFLFWQDSLTNPNSLPLYIFLLRLFNSVQPQVPSPGVPFQLRDPLLTLFSSFATLFSSRHILPFMSTVFNCQVRRFSEHLHWPCSRCFQTLCLSAQT